MINFLKAELNTYKIFHSGYVSEITNEVGEKKDFTTGIYIDVVVDNFTKTIYCYYFNDFEKDRYFWDESIYNMILENEKILRIKKLERIIDEN